MDAELLQIAWRRSRAGAFRGGVHSHFVSSAAALRPQVPQAVPPSAMPACPHRNYQGRDLVLRDGQVPQVDGWSAREPQDGGEYYVVDGVWRCGFCSGAHAVDGHISSERHLKHLWNFGVPLPLTSLEKLGWTSSWRDQSAPVRYSIPKSWCPECQCQPQAAWPQQQQQQLQLMYLQPAPTPQAPPPAPPTPPGPALPPAPPTGLPPTQAPTQVPTFPPTGVPPPSPPTEATLPAPTTEAPTAAGSAAVSVAEDGGMQQQVDDLKKQVADLRHRMQMMESAWAAWSRQTTESAWSQRGQRDSDTSSDSYVVAEAAPPI